MTLNIIVCAKTLLNFTFSRYLYFLVKISRQNSIHVSPTVMWDGLVANEVSSGWEQKNWIDFFEQKVAV